MSAECNTTAAVNKVVTVCFRCTPDEHIKIMLASQALYGPRKQSLFIRRALMQMIDDQAANFVRDDLGDDSD